MPAARPLIEAAGDFRITAVTTSRTASLNERRDAPRQESRVQAVIDAQDVDMIVVATPNGTHYAFAAAALCFGVEKGPL